MENKISTLLGPDVGYVDILDELTTDHLQKQQDDGKGFGKTPIRPSAAGACTRELTYQLMEFHGFAKYEKDLNSPEGHRIFSLGHSIEYHILRQMDDMFKGWFDIRYKQQVLSFAYLDAVNHPKLSQWLEGSTDLVIWSEKYKCIADVKSKKDKYSSYRDSAWTEFSQKMSMLKSVKSISGKAFWVDDLEAFLLEVNDPFLAANFLQLNLYACNPFIKERGIDHGAIIQYNKNDSRLREIRFRPSQKLYDAIILKFQTALDAVDHQDIERAPKDHVLGSIKCAFCSYKKECWSDSDPLKAFFKSLPPKSWPKDTDRLDAELGGRIEGLYEEYKVAAMLAPEAEAIEAELCRLLSTNRINKVRFSDKEVYEVKLYKSPREHFKLKRSKA